MIPRPGDTDTRPVAERMSSRIAVPLTAALAASAHLLGEGHRIAKAIEAVRRELDRLIEENKTPLKSKVSGKEKSRGA